MPSNKYIKNDINTQFSFILFREGKRNEIITARARNLDEAKELIISTVSDKYDIPREKVRTSIKYIQSL